MNITEGLKTSLLMNSIAVGQAGDLCFATLARDKNRVQSEIAKVIQTFISNLRKRVMFNKRIKY